MISSNILLPSSRRQYVTQVCWYLPTNLHGGETQERDMEKLTAARTPNLKVDIVFPQIIVYFKSKLFLKICIRAIVIVLYGMNIKVRGEQWRSKWVDQLVPK